MLTRRAFLKTGLLAGAAGLMGAGSWKFLSPRSILLDPLDPSTLTKFIDPLPVMPVLSPRGAFQGAPYYEVTMRPFQKKLHSQLPPTALWGYERQYPGPTIVARRGTPISVKWMNDLPTTHFLPVDETLHGAEPPAPSVRTVVHLHGLKVLPDSDGYPEAWFTNGFDQTGPFFTRQVYRYPNDQQATTLWYHDHSVGLTRLNIYAGLSGMYLLRDLDEDRLGLPRGPYEIPLIIQDRMFNSDGSLLYPVAEGGTHPFWIPEFFGDTVLVNGAVWPVLEVEPRKYRFRILNSSNARFYRMTLDPTTGSQAPAFSQIGSDGGFLPAPVSLTQLLIAPSERLDVIIDFSNFANKSFVLTNDALAPFPDGDDIVPTEIMMFKVTRPLSGRDRSVVPSSLPAPELPDRRAAGRVRDISLNEFLRPEDEFPIMALLDNKMWDDPVSENPRVGSTEIWRLINTTGDAHPIHVHLVQFQVLDRQPFDVDQYPGDLVFTGPAVPPEPNERRARKDVVIANPGTVTRILSRFDLPARTPVSRGQKFRFVYHCHILEHEDNEMMRPYDVVG